MVVAVNSDPGQFNPAITTGAHVHAVADSLFNGLVGLDENLDPIPDLATGWSVSDDGRVYTFALAEARWHDGQAVTADDVKFTFENVLFKHHARTKAGLAALVEAIETPDPRTVIFRLSAPHPAFLRRLDVTEAPILPKHLYYGVEDATEAPANTDPVGSGPYRFVSHSPGDRVVLEANTDYFKSSGPGVDRVVFRIIKDEATQILAFEQGEVDYLPGISGKDVERIEASDKGGVLSATSGPGGGNCIMTVSFNLDRDATANLAVRKAIALAVDRDRLLDQVLFDRGAVAAAPFSSAIGWAHESRALAGLPHDLAAAEALLDEAGIEPDGDGTRLQIDMVHYPNFSKYSELMAQDLAKIGIKLTPRPLDREATIDAIFMKRDFDTNLISYCNGVDPEIGIKRMYVSDNTGPIPFSNASAYRNDKVDALFATAGETSNQAERAAAYREAQTLLAEDLPYWWLVETTRNAAYNKAFEGFKPWTGHYLEEVRPAS
ncbi:MAG: ABC transporter substrate-binding protein [Inquilinaceae bacterium]